MPCQDQVGLVCNEATSQDNRTYVNGSWVMTFADTSWASGVLRAQTAAQRLNAVFTDWAANQRDLDFITPSYEASQNGGYCVVCPRVLYNGGTTYFTDPGVCQSCPPDGNARAGTGQCQSTRCLPENLYHLDNTTDDRSIGQTLITPVAIEDEPYHGKTRWHLALEFSNLIRAALLAGSNGDALGRTIQQLQIAIPSGPSSVPLYSGPATFYGDPNGPYFQGAQGSPNNICCVTTANNDIFHPLDITIGVSTELYANLANQWVRVRNPVNGWEVVARVTDITGSGKPVDLAYGGVALPLQFSSGTIELWGV